MNLADISPIKAMASHRPLHEALMGNSLSDVDIILRSTMLMSVLCQDLEQDDDAEKFSRQALQMSLNLFGPRHWETLRAMGDLAAILKSKGALFQSKHLSRIAIQLHHETWDHPESDVIWNVTQLVEIFLIQSKTQKADDLFRFAREHSRAEYGDEHPRTLNAVITLAYSLFKKGNKSESSDLLQQSVPQLVERIGESHVSSLKAMSTFAWVLFEDAKIPRSCMV